MHDKIQTNLVVFTGASSSGKTSTAQAFKKMGFEVRDNEIAREYIEELTASLREKYSDATETFINQQRDTVIKDPKSTNAILSRKLAYEASLNINTPVIIDSALACGVVYPELFNTDIDSELRDQIYQRLDQYRYKWVFSFDMLDFVEDGVRFERDQDLRDKLHTKLREQYEKLGYRYIQVPVMPFSSRVCYIDSIMKPAVNMMDKGLKLFSGSDAFGLKDTWRMRPNSMPYGLFFNPFTQVVGSDDTSQPYLYRK